MTSKAAKKQAKRSNPQMMAVLESVERRRLLAEEHRIRAKQTYAEVRDGVSETVALEEGRGEIFFRPTPRRGEQDKPARRQSGLDWLWTKKRVTADQMAAGLKYGDDWRRSEEVSLQSCLKQGYGGINDPLHEARLKAHEKLESARAIALSSHFKMIDLCNRVLGDGQRIRSIACEDDDEVKRLEAVLCVALDLLAEFYGITTR